MNVVIVLLETVRSDGYFNDSFFVFVRTVEETHILHPVMVLFSTVAFVPSDITPQ